MSLASLLDSSSDAYVRESFPSGVCEIDSLIGKQNFIQFFFVYTLPLDERFILEPLIPCFISCGKTRLGTTTQINQRQTVLKVALISV